MMRLLQIKDGMACAEWRGSGERPTPVDASWLFVDVTARPMALVGMLYNVGTDTFSATAPLDPAVQAALDADRQMQMKINTALIAYTYKSTRGGTNPTGAQLAAEIAVVKTIYKALP